MILAIVNHKGGTSKTTTAVNLAAGFAWHGKRVLLMDLDPQGSAGLSLGVKADGITSADVLLRGARIEAAARASTVPGLGVIPGGAGLLGADLTLADMPGRETQLRRALANYTEHWDAVIIDTPPGLGLVVVNALHAADKFLVPVTPAPLAFGGLRDMLDAAERVRTGTGRGAALLGIVMVMVDSRTRLAAEAVDLVRQRYGESVFKTEVPLSVRIAEAPGFGRTIYDHAPATAGSLAYRRLTIEILKRAGEAI